MAHINSWDFDADLFLRLVHGEENTWVDLKSSVIKIDTDERKKQAVRHLIALANVARRIGKTTYILFGADEDGTLYDVREHYPGRKLPRGWNARNVSVRHKQVDGVEKPFIDLAKEWIEPVPDIRLEFGVVNEKFVSYLRILPEFPHRPYRLKKGGFGQQKGAVFIRRGANSIMVRDADADSLLAANRVPYFEKSDWRQIIDCWAKDDDFKKAHEMLIRFSIIDRDHIDAFMRVKDLLEQGKQVVAVSGMAGQGKSVLLQALAYDLAINYQEPHRTLFGENIDGTVSNDDENNAQETINSIDELEVIPQSPVPVFISLRDKFDSKEDFENRLLGRLIAKQKLEAEGYYAISLNNVFAIPGSHWIIILDGIDEIFNRIEFMPSLRRWIENLPKNVQIVLSARPYALPNEEFAEVQISLLDDERALQLFQLKCDDKLQDLDDDVAREQTSEKIENIIAILQEQHTLLDMLRTPRAIDGLVGAIFPDKPETPVVVDKADPIFLVRAYSETKDDNVSDDDIDLVIDSVITPDDVVMDDENGETIKVPDIILPDETEDVVDITSLPSIFSLLKSVINHLRDEEKKRQRDLWINPVEDLELARVEIGELAWEMDWNNRVFNWIDWRSTLSRESCLWNEYMGLLLKPGTTSPFEYMFHSRDLLAFCAAEHATERLTPDDIGARFIKRREQQITRRILEFTNAFLKDGGRDTIPIQI